MAAEVRLGSSNLSALVKTVTGVKSNSDSKGTVGVKPGQKVDGKN